jgi:hypothetical protein
MEPRKLYRELSKIYNSHHNDTSSEIQNATYELEQTMAEGVKAEHIINKMKELSEFIKFSGNEFNSKLSTVILNRFWDKTFFEPIPFRELKVDA